jgi:hypothetical protein
VRRDPSKSRMMSSSCERRRCWNGTTNMYAPLSRPFVSTALTRPSQVSTLSEVFISWNDIVSSAEETVARLEREQAHRTVVDVS